MGRPSRGYKLRELPGGCWQVRFSHAGKRYELSTEELDLDRAEAKARQIYAAVISGRWAPGSQLAAPGAPVWQVAAGWLDAIESMVEKTTRKQYGIYVTAHWQPHFKEMEAFARPTMVPSYVRARLKSVRRRTLQKELSALRGFLAWCHEVGHLPEAITIPKLTVKSPGTPDQRKKHKSVPIELTVADVRAILALLPEMSKGSRVRPPFPIRDFFTVCYETGLRPDATVAHLEPGDLRAGELAVRDEIDKARFGRSVPLTPLARECLERHATRPGKPIFGKASRATYLRAAALLAGKPGVSAYDFRHNRATHLMESSGNNILGVGYLLGHTQATTTNRYARQTHRAAVTVLSSGLFSGSVDPQGTTRLEAAPAPAPEKPGTSLPAARKHGHARAGAESPEYRSWKAMLTRCYNPKGKRYSRYGGRGIEVCQEWRQNFAAFLSYVGLKPSQEHTLGRLKNEGNYEPGNVAWQTPVEQGRDRGNSVRITAFGRTEIVAEWARLTGLEVETIRKRLRRGHLGEDALKGGNYDPCAKQTHRAAMTVLQQGGDNGNRRDEHVHGLGAGRLSSDPASADGPAFEGSGAQPGGVARGVGRHGRRVPQDSGGGPERLNQLGTTGNVAGAKEGNRTPTGVTPQEPERFDLSEITGSTPGQLPGERHGTSTNDRGRHLSWVSAPDVFDLVASYLRVTRRAS